MRHTPRDEKNAETRVLGAIAIVCYSSTLAAMLAFGYSLLALALKAAGRDLGLLLTSSGA